MLMVGPGASVRLAQAIGAFAHRKVLVVTDEVITQLGLAVPMADALAAAGTAFVVFDQVAPDAPIAVVEQGLAVFRDEACDAIVAIGGGSVIDAAKAIGLSAANGKHPSELVGYFKGLHGPVPIYAVPTTAGTGSEVTVAAVISDPAANKKLVIADTRIVPCMAALDPCLMTGLPAHITAATGMDALTHAVEAYLGHWSTEFTDRMALSAVGMIYQNLPLVFADGQDLAAREKMALASTFAGLAFTRANVGNVHAIAHQLGGLYHTPHGLANAIMLAPVLRFYGATIQAKLAVLAVRARVGRPGEPEATLAQKFLDSVEALNRSLGIPQQLAALREQDIPELAEAACEEADMNYPVPSVMSQQACEGLLREVLPDNPGRQRAARKKSVTAKPAARKANARHRAGAQ
jgi:alcohol dehydrogenase class IV